jgi:hypothetical protein
MSVLVRNAREAILSADDGVVCRPELELHNIVQQSINTVWTEDGGLMPTLMVWMVISPEGVIAVMELSMPVSPLDMS